jgi:hypothetical protein
VPVHPAGRLRFMSDRALGGLRMHTPMHCCCHRSLVEPMVIVLILVANGEWAPSCMPLAASHASPHQQGHQATRSRPVSSRAHGGNPRQLHATLTTCPQHCHL